MQVELHRGRHLAFLPVLAACALGCVLVLSACSKSADQTASADALGDESPEPQWTVDGATSAITPEQAMLPWKGDWEGMLKRRTIRILTVYGRSVYFIDNGVQRGTVYDAGKHLEDEINREIVRRAKAEAAKAAKAAAKAAQSAKTKNKKDKTPAPAVAAAPGAIDPSVLRVHVLFIPVKFSEQIPALLAGKGDVVMANLTVTPERTRKVDFTQPWITNVRELVVSAPGTLPLNALDDLSGQEVFVRRSSSYYEHLKALNANLVSRRLVPIKIVPAPESLSDDDLMEMVNAGLIKRTVIDSHKVALWRQVLKNMVVNEKFALREHGVIAWAVRKDSPRLKDVLDDFLVRNGERTTFGNLNFKKYLASTRYVKDAISGADMMKFKALADTFQQYGKKYELDWLLMAAQGYQESRLDQKAKSAVGAIGIMQVMPSTGQIMKVGDIHHPEPNIHAGIKYDRYIIDQYFSRSDMDAMNRELFAIAAYNAGPTRIRKLQAETEKRGLNPNVWFDNVERIVAEKVGRETVTYVSNIYKYYVAYALMMRDYKSRMEAREQLAEMNGAYVAGN